jgi:arabinofuranosyltransferase
LFILPLMQPTSLDLRTPVESAGSTQPHLVPLKYRVSFLALITVFLVICHTFPFSLVDDAYISFRYAHNLAHHGELVFNLHERVEGITNLLWTLLLAIQIKVFGFPSEYAAVYIALALIMFMMGRLVQIGRLIAASYQSGVAAALLLVLNPHFLGALTNGLEACLYAALLLEVIYRIAREQWNAAHLAAGFLFLTRPDSIGPILLLCLYTALSTRAFPTILTGMMLTGSIMIGVTLFRIVYYDSPLPNSIIAKSFALGLLPWQQAFAYVQGFLTENVGYAILFFTALLWLLFGATGKARTSLLAGYCCGVILWSFVVAIRNGGDWMPHHRLLLQYGVVYGVLLIVLLQRLLLSALSVAALLLVLSIQMIAHIPFRSPHASFLSIDTLQWGFYDNVANRLAPVLIPTDSLSSEGLGVLSYRFLSLYVHDPLGLTDKYLARHGRSSIPYGSEDAAYTLGTVRPSVALWLWAGHVQTVDQATLAQYETFCAEDCDNWGADIVMIRKDRVADLGAVFADWKQITLTTGRITPLHH